MVSEMVRGTVAFKALPPFRTFFGFVFGSDCDVFVDIGGRIMASTVSFIMAPVSMLYAFLNFLGRVITSDVPMFLTVARNVFSSSMMSLNGIKYLNVSKKCVFMAFMTYMLQSIYQTCEMNIYKMTFMSLKGVIA